MAHLIFHQILLQQKYMSMGFGKSCLPVTAFKNQENR